MRRFVWLGAVTVAVFTMGAGAQMQHAPDGGTRETIQSIDVPEKAGTPFQAQVVTSWKRRLEDGTEITVYNRRMIARDSQGRVFQERRFLTPDGNVHPTMVSEMDYLDPTTKERTVCTTRDRRCMVYHRSVIRSEETPQLAATQTYPNGVTVTRESLGANTIEDVQVTGMREIMTSPQLGAREPSVKEFWYSQQLGMNLVVKRFQPRGGAQDFTVEKIDQTEPSAALFAPPKGYQMVDVPAAQAVATR